MTTTWACIFSLTAVGGCSGTNVPSLSIPDGPAPTPIAPPDSGGAFADAAIEAPAAEGGDDSVADGTIDHTTMGKPSDHTTMGKPSGDDASAIGVNVFDTSMEPEAAAGDAADSAPHDPDGAVQGGGLDMGLVALYHFDETSGTTAADSSGNGNTATMQGGATFSPGVRGSAATFSGDNQYVSLPTGIVSALTNFSIAAWIYQNRGSVGFGDRLFDFGTGITDNMFVTTDADVLRYAVTTGGHKAEENLLTPGIIFLQIWQHITVTQAAATTTLYLDGAAVAQNTAATLHPATLGVTTQNWIGRSQYANDHYLAGEVDEFRIYNRALSGAEVIELYVQRR